MMRELCFSLGMEIKKTPKGTLIYQEKYNKELLKKFKNLDAKLIDTLMGTNSKLDVDNLALM